MGIPKFFRWLTRRYPLILQTIEREEDCPPADNLYMDLNSIVHNCIHGNDAQKHAKVSKMEDLEDVWADIMSAIDEIVHSVKPKKVILLALDGVAPRAKMNQQRARRFRAAKDSDDLKKSLAAAGKDVPDLFDSNQISPGTKFMYELGKQLEWFVKFKLNTDPLYQNCEKVLLSDSSVPGEGEHKMMDYIRNLKLEPGYDPNTRHCFYGSDADLIMLSLITHEPHFMIIREEHVIKKTKQGGIQRIDISRTANLQLIHISVLREYFLLEYRGLAGSMKMRFDLERVIDDFVFFCFFIGNDFLPSLSALDISEGSLDHLINFYKKILPQMTDYITCEGHIHWDRAEQFIAMLGKHEHMVFINRVKTLDAKYRDSKSTVAFDQGVSNVLRAGEKGGHIAGPEKTKLIQEQLHAKLKQKKQKKCSRLFEKNQQKRYKKQLLLKKYAEDYEETKSNEGDQFVMYQSLLGKYKKKRDEQMKKDNKKVGEEADGEQETLHEVLEDLREEFFSDLNPEEVPNSDVSDVSDPEEQMDKEQTDQSLEPAQAAASQIKIEMVKKASEQAIEDNHQFMRDFVNTYKHDANEAKRNYYLQKLKFDVHNTKGKKDLHKMLFRYLEGLQWVYFYYYKGAQHWRWYYPYHYAPMISDLGTNVVQDFLEGKKVITDFKPDENCNADSRPYTPFQQLLCILPVKSLRAFLPREYVSLAEGVLKEYFPSDFTIDLNGRTLPWEAAILIPFADEAVFVQAEAAAFADGMALTDEEGERNTISFAYPGISYDRSMQQGSSLSSTLKGMKDYPDDRTRVVIQRDYEKVGQFCFPSKQLKGVVSPQPDFPSMHWLNVAELDFAEVYINKVCFKQALAKVPQHAEDANGAEFENWIYKFAESKLKELYGHFPRQIEAFPLHFEDPYSVYQLAGDPGTGQVKVTKLRQNKTPEEFAGMARVLRASLEAKGIKLTGDVNTFVTVCTLNCLEYDDERDELYKLYSEQSMTLPFNLVMKKRDPYHYLNVNERTATPFGRIKAGGEAICFNEGLFGVLGKAKGKDGKRGTVKLEINKEIEERKIHHPFVAENFLRREMAEGPGPTNRAPGSKQAQASQKQAGAGESQENQRNDQQPITGQRIKDEIRNKKYYGDQEIEVLLNLKFGVVNKLTGSFLIAFDEVGKDERQVVDIGLNVKNYTKKVHVAEYVRFVAPHAAANTIYDEFQHNQHARGAKHVRKHWEYSQECFDIIKAYGTKFPEALEAVHETTGRKSKAMHSLQDLYPAIPRKEKDTAIKKLKEVLAYLETLPISKLPYVEMGFDALDSVLIRRLERHQDYVLRNYGAIELDVQRVEHLRTSSVYQEMYPYWFRPYLEVAQVSAFRVGNRVMNVNSSMRHYVPFGARGTVVGKTEALIIVLFDEQFIQGSNIYGHCQKYRGALLDPVNVINLSRAFATMQNKQVARRFQERPLKGQKEFQDAEEAAEDGQVVKNQGNDEEISLREQFIQSRSGDKPAQKQRGPQGQGATAQKAGGAATADAGRGPRPRRPEESKQASEPDTDKADQQEKKTRQKAWAKAAEAKPFVPSNPQSRPSQTQQKQTQQTQQQAQMVYQPKAAQTSSEAQDAGAQMKFAEQSPAAGGNLPSPAADQIDSSQTAGSNSRAPDSSAAQSSALLFKPLPRLQLGDPKLLAAPGQQSNAGPQQDGQQHKDGDAQ